MPTPFWPQMSPGIAAPIIASFKALFLSRSEQFLAQGRYISGPASRDPSNATDVAVLQPGLIMGKISSVVNGLGTVGFYAPSILGLTSLAIAATDTTITLPAAVCTEIARRCGASGTVTVTGPPVASGTVRSLTATYSAVGATTITITALGVTEVQTFNFANSPSGNFVLAIVDKNGVVQYTQPIAYSSTVATLKANLQAATDAALAVNAIVWGGSAVTAITATFSGTGYANLPQTLIVADTDAWSAGSLSITRTTAGVDGRFVTSSIVAPTDGSQNPLSFITDWSPGIPVVDGNGNSVAQVDFGLFPIWGVLDTTQIVNFPADPSL